MRAIFGLGNPGIKYHLTRHNIGFTILNSLAAKHKLSFKSGKRDYYFSEGKILSSDFFLIKPTTFMNLSGIAVKEFMHFYSLSLEDIIIVVDDINLEFGKIRIRQQGSDGGHNGLKSIIYNLNSNSFARLRFGVGNQFTKGELSSYVLDKFNKQETEKISTNVAFSVTLLEEFIIGGYKQLLSLYSKNQKELKKGEQ